MNNNLGAILLITPEVLAQLLQLPEGSYIDSAHAPHDRPGMLELRIRGAGWPVLPGGRLTQVTGIVTREPKLMTNPSVDWRLRT